MWCRDGRNEEAAADSVGSAGLVDQVSCSGPPHLPYSTKVLLIQHYAPGGFSSREPPPPPFPPLGAATPLI